MGRREEKRREKIDMRFGFDVICIQSTYRLGTAKGEAIHKLTSQARIVWRISSIGTLYIFVRPPGIVFNHWLTNSLHMKYDLYFFRAHILFFISLNFPMTSIGFVLPVASCTAGS